MKKATTRSTDNIAQIILTNNIDAMTYHLKYTVSTLIHAQNVRYLHSYTHKMSAIYVCCIVIRGFIRTDKFDDYL